MIEYKDIYVSIGNSDDKLSRARWQDFLYATERAIKRHYSEWRGVWFSEPRSLWLHACWAFKIREVDIPDLQKELKEVADLHDQDSIAWAEAITSFIKPGEEMR